MGVCTSKPRPSPEHNFHSSEETKSSVVPAQDEDNPVGLKSNAGNAKDSGNLGEKKKNEENPEVGKKSPFFPFYSPSPAHYLFSKKSPARSPAPGSGTPRRFFKKPFPPPSPAKHIKAVLARRHGSVKPNEAAIPEERRWRRRRAWIRVLGFPRIFIASTSWERKWAGVILVILMTTAIAIEDVRKEVKILRALTGHNNLIQFYDAYEDQDNVYIVMELCEGGELLDRILSRGGKYTEEDAKTVMIQILNVVAFCHLQGVVHRDLKPENFLFTSKEENSTLKAIDFGLSDFVKPDERLNDIVGSAYYVAPEVLHRAYSTEADVWSIGVIAYILLCGSRPFWARTESGIFRAVVKAEPTYEEPPWPTLSSEAKDFVKRLLNKDPRKRMTAAQAMCHPWLRNTNDVKVPLDILILKLMKVYMRSSPSGKLLYGGQGHRFNNLGQSFPYHDNKFALVASGAYCGSGRDEMALSKTLTEDELFYLKKQFALLEPSKNGTISLDNIISALKKNATDAMNKSRIYDFLASLNALQYRRMDFEEFCAAASSVYQLEALDRWEQHARCAYELFDKDGNRTIMIEELASELGLSPSIPVHAVLHDWIRHTDGKLSFLGFVKLLHGVSSRSIAKAH
ncbi:UNVERIFIED_CONTAM: CDPK-related kinase [Sesamum latifolium]|uniref:CDPK-related kinase n=1 Tax=Sesamum latifolium TaxID=2727402 RepID=A0AAW2Y6T8_9LAMI